MASAQLTIWIFPESSPSSGSMTMTLSTVSVLLAAVITLLASVDFETIAILDPLSDKI